MVVHRASRPRAEALTATLLEATTQGTGVGVDVEPFYREHAFYITGSGGTITAGAVAIETARSALFPGNWATLGGAPVTVVDGIAVLQVTGALLAVRARVTATVTGGGAVAVEYVGT